MLHIVVFANMNRTMIKLETTVIWQVSTDAVLILNATYISIVKVSKHMFFHNLKGYGSHFIICNAHEFHSKRKIGVIAQNSEKFIMFGFGNLQFKDSISFLPSSLDILVGLSKYKDYDDIRSGNIAWKDREYLDNWKDNFKHSGNSSCVNNCEDLDMLTDKGVYPYDYMNSWGRFNDTEPRQKKTFIVNCMMDV